MARLLLALVVCCLAVCLGQIEAVSPPSPRYCCPSFWTQRDNRCYRFVGKRMIWHDAQTYCKNLHPRSNLVSLNTKGEAEFVQHLFLEKSGGVYEHYWTGLTDKTQEGHYFWTGINRPLVYSKWHIGQPDNWHGEDCTEVWTKSGFWNDQSCTDKQSFICELPRA